MEIKNSVFYSFFSDSQIVPIIKTKFRIEEIEKTKNDLAKKQKLFAFYLLEHVLEKIFNLDLSSLSLRKENGKVLAKGLNVSLTHTKNLVAVAVCKDEVGVDAEVVKPVSTLFLKKIFDEQELENFKNFSEKDLFEREIKKWTELESYYKLDNLATIKTKILNEQTSSIEIERGGDKFFLTVASKEKTHFEFKEIKF